MSGHSAQIARWLCGILCCLFLVNGCGRAEPGAAARDFARDLVAGNIDAALARCAVGMKRTDIEFASRVLRNFGALKDVAITTVEEQEKAGAKRYQLAGTAAFEKATKKYTLTLQKDGEKYLVVKYAFD